MLTKLVRIAFGVQLFPRWRFRPKRRFRARVDPRAFWRFWAFWVVFEGWSALEPSLFPLLLRESRNSLELAPNFLRDLLDFEFGVQLFPFQYGVFWTQRCFRARVDPLAFWRLWKDFKDFEGVGAQEFPSPSTIEPTKKL